MVLPDTSVWIDFARRGAGGRVSSLGELLDSGEVATCGPVLAEVLAGAEGEVEEKTWATLSSLPWLDLDPASWRQVGASARRMHRAGTPVPLTDLVIAVTAVHAGHSLWSLDADFERIATVLEGLELYAPPV